MAAAMPTGTVSVNGVPMLTAAAAVASGSAVCSATSARSTAAEIAKHQQITRELESQGKRFGLDALLMRAVCVLERERMLHLLAAREARAANAETTAQAELHRALRIEGALRSCLRAVGILAAWTAYGGEGRGGAELELVGEWVLEEQPLADQQCPLAMVWAEQQAAAELRASGDPLHAAIADASTRGTYHMLATALAAVV